MRNWPAASVCVLKTNGDPLRPVGLSRTEPKTGPPFSSTSVPAMPPEGCSGTVLVIALETSASSWTGEYPLDHATIRTEPAGTTIDATPLLSGHCDGKSL